MARTAHFLPIFAHMRFLEVTIINTGTVSYSPGVFYSPIMPRNSCSEIIVTPSSCAFVSLLPASSPART